MTEAEWLGPDAISKCDLWEKRFSARKIRLWQVACCRRVVATVRSKWLREALDVAERWADVQLTADALRLYSSSAWRAVRERLSFALTPAEERVAEAVLDTVEGYRNSPASITIGLERAVQFSTNVFERREAVATESRAHLALLHDIFGNPFRPTTCSPDWRTSTVVALAQGIYESRDFGAMPILADALQDAGCDNEAVLSHCRSEGPHVRGCWVVDLVLGKE